MNKPWVGYLSSFLLLLAGILMIAGDQLIIGVIFIVLSLVGIVLKYYINKRK
jgi:hypothetical protein